MGGGGGGAGDRAEGVGVGCAGVCSWGGFQLVTSSSVLRSKDMISCRT